MNAKTLLVRTVITFAVLAATGIGMAVGARNLASPFDQTVLMAVGVAIFGASLAFFLVRVFSLVRKIKKGK
jgi:hypothetical protein